MTHERIAVECSKLQNKGRAIKDREKKWREKRRMGDGDKQSDRDREGLKEMEAAMKKLAARTNMESSKDWFDLPLFFPLSLPPPVFPTLPSLLHSARAPSAKEKSQLALN